MGPRAGERGFTLIEVVIAVALWIVLGGALLYLTQGLLAQTQTLAAQRSAYEQLTRLVDTFDAEATSSLAIFIPPADVLGNDNSDGHELDFYSRDAQRLGHFWAYRWDQPTSTLQRYTYAQPGAEASAGDPPLHGITAFQATRLPASTISRPFLAGYAARDVVVNFGYPGVDGGNAITAVSFSNARNRFSVELLPGTMASGFQVVVATFVPSPAPTAGSPTSTPAATASPTSVASSSAPTSAPTSTPLSGPTATPTPRATSTPARTPTPQPTATPCYGEFSITLTFFGVTWWEGQQSGSPCGGAISSVAYVFPGFSAVDMEPLNSAFTAIPHPGLAVGYFVELQDMNELSAIVLPGSFINDGDTLAASAALPCKFIMYSNPAIVQVLVGFGGYPISTNDSVIPAIIANLQSAIPGCVPVE